ncbi:hypothetical protein B7P43_G16812 [Cryptotermes secundus]|uniref:Uncharacterized protein n=1 Tax=Cryptotermes secundus TaxID=105785 RepID=A0A2J7QUN1_9NEOP|nr:hypothetical protein B7P43_G16812 [Cryptotermes secundus]
MIATTDTQAKKRSCDNRCFLCGPCRDYIGRSDLPKMLHEGYGYGPVANRSLVVSLEVTGAKMN